MRFFRSPKFFLLLALASGLARAQTPVLTQSIPTQTVGLTGGAVNVDLRNYFSEPTITGQVVQFDTVLGKFNVELLASDAPLSVQNFLAYVSDNSYVNSFVHRSTSLNGAGGNRIVQGGGYLWDGNAFATIAKKAPIALEYKLANARGTLAMARTSDQNSATSEWFFNVDDNTTALGASNGGGYAVFGRVLGSGMIVVDGIAGLPSYDLSNNNSLPQFGTVPLRNVTAGQTSVRTENLVIVNSLYVVPIYPTPTNTKAVIEFAVATVSGSNVVTATLSGSTLVLTPLAVGTATLTVRAGDVNGNFVSSGNFTVNVVASNSAPAITAQPTSQTTPAGATVAFSVSATGTPAPTYQWMRGSTQPGAGTPALIPGATGATLILSGTTGTFAALPGTYSVVVTNSVNSVTSTPAVLSNSPTSNPGRLTNLSVLAALTATVPDFTVATVVGGGSGTKSLLARAVGPSLAQLGVGGFVPNPQMEFYTRSTLSATNDDWGGGQTLRDAFASVGAFPYASAGSLDAALLRPSVQPDAYSVKVSGGGGTGLVLAEIYDASPSFDATSQRLLDVSVLKQIDAGDSLTVGFHVGGGAARTVLVRAVGPGLGALGVGGTMPDPQLQLYSGQTVLVANDNWGGDAQFNTAFDSVGAFRISNAASKDAVAVATLAPGDYTVVVRPVAGTAGGLALVEVYDVP